ncbi:hypothetical protein CCACVL1_07079, partial [Corchorus capsularis]
EINDPAREGDRLDVVTSLLTSMGKIDVLIDKEVAGSITSGQQLQAPVASR